MKKADCVQIVHVVATEHTGKQWKFLAAFAWFVVFGGGIAWLLSENPESQIFAWSVLTFGAVLRVVAQLGKWWNHA